MHATINNIRVPTKIKRIWWQEKGLSFTGTGYGARIPTEYMMQWEGRWRRVYCRIYSNTNTLYIGKIEDGLIVQIED